MEGIGNVTNWWNAWDFLKNIIAWVSRKMRVSHAQSVRLDIPVLAKCHMITCPTQVWDMWLYAAMNAGQAHCFHEEIQIEKNIVYKM